MVSMIIWKPPLFMKSFVSVISITVHVLHILNHSSIPAWSDSGEMQMLSPLCPLEFSTPLYQPVDASGERIKFQIVFQLLHQYLETPKDSLEGPTTTYQGF